MSTWKTLADVPRDGRAVLLWGPKRPDPATWAWNQDEGCWDANHERQPVIDVAVPSEGVAFKTAVDSEFVLWSAINPPD